MNMKKFIPNIGFAITLLALSQSATGFQKISSYCLVGIIALAAIVLLFENKISKHWWARIVQQAEGLDISYIAFGLGLMLVSREFSSSVWVSLSFLVAGTVFSGAGIGKLIGKGGFEVIEANAKIGIVLGFIYFIVGVVVWILTWNSIVENPLINATYPVIIICAGIIFIYFGFRKWRKKSSVAAGS